MGEPIKTPMITVPAEYKCRTRLRELEFHTVTREVQVPAIEKEDPAKTAERVKKAVEDLAATIGGYHGCTVKRYGEELQKPKEPSKPATPPSGESDEDEELETALAKLESCYRRFGGICWK